MKAAVHVGPGKLEFQEVPEPVPGYGEIKIRVEYAGICGSDVDIIFDRFPFQKLDWWPKGPQIEGHEASGTIAEIGPGVRQPFHVGQHVGLGFRAGCGVCYYCQNGLETMCEFEQRASGTFAQYAIFPEGAVFPLAEDVSYEVAALLEPLSIATHLVEQTGVKPGQSLYISGTGTIGLMSLAVALQAGASPLMISGRKANKREKAIRMGADLAVDPLANGGDDLSKAAAKITSGRGFDAIIEATGNSETATAALDLAARGGTVVWGGVYPDGKKLLVDPQHMFAKELTIKGAYLAPYAFYRAIALLTKLDLSEIVTDVYPLKDAQAALDHHLKGEGVKTLLQCW